MRQPSATALSRSVIRAAPNGPALGNQNEFLQWFAGDGDRFVVEKSGPNADRMVDGAARARPGRVHSAHAAVADDPLRICPAVGDDVPHLLAAGRGISRDDKRIARFGRRSPGILTIGRVEN
jgi:hypothetical protein